MCTAVSHSSFKKRRGVFIGIFVVLMISFYKVSTVPPGYITHTNHHKYNRYPYDYKVGACVRHGMNDNNERIRILCVVCR